LDPFECRRTSLFLCSSWELAPLPLWTPTFFNLGDI